MTQKRKRSSVVEIGTDPARVKIYTVNRKDGYSMFSLYWREGSQRKSPFPRPPVRPNGSFRSIPPKANS